MKKLLALTSFFASISAFALTPVANTLRCELYKFSDAQLKQGKVNVEDLQYAFEHSEKSNLILPDSNTGLELHIQGIGGTHPEINFITLIDQKEGLTAIYEIQDFLLEKPVANRTMRVEAQYKGSIISTVCHLE